MTVTLILVWMEELAQMGVTNSCVTALALALKGQHAKPVSFYLSVLSIIQCPSVLKSHCPQKKVHMFWAFGDSEEQMGVFCIAPFSRMMLFLFQTSMIAQPHLVWMEEFVKMGWTASPVTALGLALKEPPVKLVFRKNLHFRMFLSDSEPWNLKIAESCSRCGWLFSGSLPEWRNLHRHGQWFLLWLHWNWLRRANLWNELDCCGFLMLLPNLIGAVRFTFFFPVLRTFVSSSDTTQKNTSLQFASFLTYMKRGTLAASSFSWKFTDAESNFCLQMLNISWTKKTGNCTNVARLMRGKSVFFLCQNVI